MNTTQHVQTSVCTHVAQQYLLHLSLLFCSSSLSPYANPNRISANNKSIFKPESTVFSSASLYACTAASCNNTLLSKFKHKLHINLVAHGRQIVGFSHLRFTHFCIAQVLDSIRNFLFQSLTRDSDASDSLHTTLRSFSLAAFIVSYNLESSGKEKALHTALYSGAISTNIRNIRICCFTYLMLSSNPAFSLLSYLFRTINLTLAAAPHEVNNFGIIRVW